MIVMDIFSKVGASPKNDTMWLYLLFPVTFFCLWVICAVSVFTGSSWWAGLLFKYLVESETEEPSSNFYTSSKTDAVFHSSFIPPPELNPKVWTYIIAFSSQEDWKLITKPAQIWGVNQYCPTRQRRAWKDRHWLCVHSGTGLHFGRFLFHSSVLWHHKGCKSLIYPELEVSENEYEPYICLEKWSVLYDSCVFIKI